MAGNENSGRRGFGEEIKNLKEEIKNMTIEELAADKVFGHLKTIEEKKDRQGVKDIALPVYLKSKADKQDIKLKVEPIYGSLSRHKGNETHIQPDEKD